jgi:hypothetical protein
MRSVWNLKPRGTMRAWGEAGSRERELAQHDWAATTQRWFLTSLDCFPSSTRTCQAVRLRPCGAAIDLGFPSGQRRSGEASSPGRGCGLRHGSLLFRCCAAHERHRRLLHANDLHSRKRLQLAVWVYPESGFRCAVRTLSGLLDIARLAASSRRWSANLRWAIPRVRINQFGAGARQSWR